MIARVYWTKREWNEDSNLRDLKDLFYCWTSQSSVHLLIIKGIESTITVEPKRISLHQENWNRKITWTNSFNRVMLLMMQYHRMDRVTRTKMVLWKCSITPEAQRLICHPMKTKPKQKSESFKMLKGKASFHIWNLMKNTSKET